MKISGANFNGYSSYIQVDYNSIFDIRDELTIAAFVIPRRMDKYQGILARYYRFPYGFHITDSGYYQFGVTLEDGTAIYRSSSFTPTLNEVQFVGVSWKSDGIVTFWKDYDEETVTITAGRLGVYNYPVTIGARSIAPADVFNGEILGVYLYNRFLSSSERREIFKNPTNPDEGGLVLWIPLNENMGVVAKDHSRYGNHGRMYNCKWVTPVRRGWYFDNGGMQFNINKTLDFNYCSVVAVFAIDRLQKGGEQTYGRNCVFSPFGGDQLMLWNQPWDRKLRFTNNDGTWKAISTNVDLQDGEIYTGVGIMNGNEEHIYLASNGVIIDHNLRTDIGDAGSFAINPIVGGKAVAYRYPLHGRVLAAMVYDRPISESEIEQISDEGWFDPPRDGLIFWTVLDGVYEGETPVDKISGVQATFIGNPRPVIRKPFRVVSV